MKDIIIKNYNKLFPPNHYPYRKGKKTNFIFVHINKCGGTSLAKAIGLYAKRHYTVKEIIDIVDKDWYRAFTFSIVRNPYARAVSQYEHRKRKNHDNLNKANISFPEWVKLVYEKRDEEYLKAGEKFFQTQKFWLLDNSNKINIDYIGKFEDINQEFDQIASIIGLKSSLPHLNKTKRKNYKEYYDKNTKEIIETFFEEDFKEFNYPLEKI